MLDANLLPAIREALKQNEIGNGSPYVLSYARLGASGASFGIFQGDTNVNATARDVLRQVLQTATADAVTVGRIMTAVSQPCPNGSPLSAVDAALADKALGSAAGRALVDAMDQTLLNVVLRYLQQCLDAAAKKGWPIAPVALLYIALWTNMTGAPNMLSQWLGGTSVMGLAAPAGPVITQADMETYLQATSYFHAHPRNFLHMQQSVAAGAKLLPAAGGRLTMDGFLHAATALIAPNMGHILSLASALTLTALALAPILTFVIRGWATKRSDVFSCFSEDAKILYLKTFLKLNLADGAADKEFSDLYDRRYGRWNFAFPTALFIVVCVAAMFVFSETGVTQISLIANGTQQSFGTLPPGWFSFLVISGVPAAGISGAYLWLVSDLIAKSYRLNLKPADVLGAALRLAMAAAIAFGVTAMAKDSVALPLAFALGAFPLDAVRIMVRRFATKTLGLGVGVDAEFKDPITKLNGIDQPTADRLMDADISTITQLAYCDPVQLCMKTGYLFAVIVDFASQALAWNYFEAKLDALRPAGLRGAMEIWDLLDDLRNKPGTDDALRAGQVMDEAATMAGMSVVAFYNGCEEIAGDPYTIFLTTSWRQ